MSIHVNLLQLRYQQNHSNNFNSTIPIMAETPTTTSSEPRTPPSSASEQARIRKERREAKIRAGGSARLDKITGLGGGIPRGT